MTRSDIQALIIMARDKKKVLYETTTRTWRTPDNLQEELDAGLLIPANYEYRLQEPKDMLKRLREYRKQYQETIEKLDQRIKNLEGLVNGA